MEESVIQTSACNSVSQRPKEVEKQLKQVSRKLAETEVNIGLFNKMAKNGVPTNDVRHFVLNQAKMKQSHSKVQYDVVRKIMRSKFNDACSTANKLRQKKRRLKRLLCTNSSFSTSERRKVMREIAFNTANHKGKHKFKCDKKFRHCQSKMGDVLFKRSLRGVPREVWAVASGVNIFHTNITPQECADPMICSKNIKLSKDEMNFLRKGPRFMLRTTGRESDFVVELEKMVIKDKYEATRDGRDMNDSMSDRLANKDESTGDLDALTDEIEARAGMMYSKRDKILNLGKLRATNYKFNKHICLPKPETAYREAVHEVRKTEMLKIFRKTLSGKNRSEKKKSQCPASEVSNMSPPQDGNSVNQDFKRKSNVSGVSVSSNLTPSEQRGLKSLQERVRSNELVVTETDKSRRFCVLEKSQYELSGKKHTDKDIRILPDQLHSIQKHVNDHNKWLKRIFNIGSEWGQEGRISNSMVDKGEVVSPLYLLIKDHKSWSEEDGSPPPSRPICSGNVGFNRHISEVLSMILEPLGHALGGADIDSTGGLLSKVAGLNEKLKAERKVNDHEKGVFNIHSTHTSDHEKGAFNIPSERTNTNDILLRPAGRKSQTVSGRETGVFNIPSEHTSDQRTGAFNNVRPHPDGRSSKTSQTKSGHETGVFNIHSEQTSDQRTGVFNSRMLHPDGRSSHSQSDHETGVFNKLYPQSSDQEPGVFNNKVLCQPDGKSSQSKNDDECGTFNKDLLHPVSRRSNSKCEERRKFNKDLKLARADRLRSLKLKGTHIPNIKAKLWAVRLQDEALGMEAVNIPGQDRGTVTRVERPQEKNIPQMQKDKDQSYTIVGNDVEALFPSLLDIESARIARQAVLMSDIKFDNIDYDLALKYLIVAGGKCHVEEIGLKKIAPKWLGSRQDLLTVGGDSIDEKKKWSPIKRDLTAGEKKQVLARVVETAVLVCMCTHVYSFNGHLYIQCKGGPIGMRFTASLASVVMKFWDLKWLDLLKRECVVFDLYLRYVDDCRLFLPVFNKGWTWNNDRMCYSVEQFNIDQASGESDVTRTTKVITKAMCSLTSFLKFTGEDCTDFPDGTLPTLDTTLWIENNIIMHKFYEKPTVGNRVLMKDTALPTACIRASLLQETVRRLQNCSLDLALKEKQEVLSNFAIKLINSGHSVKSTRIILVQGITKFMYKVELSNLDPDDVNYKPLYLDKEFDEDERQVNKYLAKMVWFKNKGRKNNCGPEGSNDNNNVLNWRDRLKGSWRGEDMSQRRVKNMDFTTVLQVPNTNGGVLARNLMRAEEKLARVSGYNVKIVEQSGIQLCRMFDRVFPNPTCHWDDCPTCLNSTKKGGSKCRKSNVVYEATCIECESASTSKESETKIIGPDDPSASISKYIGETSRTLAERSAEHITAASNFDLDSFIVKHWVAAHPALSQQPRIKFAVRSSFKDPLTRLVTEAVLIEKESNLNSKSEWGHNKLKRLVVDKPAWMDSSEDIEADPELVKKVDALKQKLGAKVSKMKDSQDHPKSRSKRPAWSSRTHSTKRVADDRINSSHDHGSLSKRRKLQSGREGGAFNKEIILSSDHGTGAFNEKIVTSAHENGAFNKIRLPSDQGTGTSNKKVINDKSTDHLQSNIVVCEVNNSIRAAGKTMSNEKPTVDKTDTANKITALSSCALSEKILNSSHEDGAFNKLRMPGGTFQKKVCSGSYESGTIINNERAGFIQNNLAEANSSMKTAKCTKKTVLNEKSTIDAWSNIFKNKLNHQYPSCSSTGSKMVRRRRKGVRGLSVEEKNSPAVQQYINVYINDELNAQPNTCTNPPVACRLAPTRGMDPTESSENEGALDPVGDLFEIGDVIESEMHTSQSTFDDAMEVNHSTDELASSLGSLGANIPEAVLKTCAVDNVCTNGSGHESGAFNSDIAKPPKGPKSSGGSYNICSERSGHESGVFNSDLIKKSGHESGAFNNCVTKPPKGPKSSGGSNNYTSDQESGAFNKSYAKPLKGHKSSGGPSNAHVENEGIPSTPLPQERTLDPVRGRSLEEEERTDRVIEVGEQMRDYDRLQFRSTSESTSSKEELCAPSTSRIKKFKKKRGKSEEKEDRSSTVTSTPLKLKVRRRVKMMRKRKLMRKPQGSLDKIKKKLDEGLNVSLSPSSMSSAPEAESRPSMNGEGSVDIQFDTMTSSVAAELRNMLSDFDDSQSEVDWRDLSDPDLEGALINLIGPCENKLSSPFQLTDRIRRELIRRAEQAGSRALDWSMSSYDKIGGEGTLRSVWIRLKDGCKVGGRKRRANGRQVGAGKEGKRIKECLNISSTCSRLMEILLSPSRSTDRAASVTSDTVDRASVSHDDEVESAQVVLVSDTEESLPGLTSSERGSTSSDSGMSMTVGQVTDLCGDRRPPVSVRSGVVTETNLYMPITLGFSDASVSSDGWEVVHDLDGNPTGMEVLEVGVRRLALEDENGLSDDGYAGTTRNRLSSIQWYPDDARRLLEIQHINPHAVVSIGNRGTLRLNVVCSYILWAIIVSMWLGLDVRADTGVHKRMCSNLNTEKAFEIGQLVYGSIPSSTSDHETGAFNNSSCSLNDSRDDGQLGASGHETGVFNRYSSGSIGRENASSGRETGVFNRYSYSGRGNGAFNRYSSSSIGRENVSSGRETGAFNSGHENGVFNNKRPSSGREDTGSCDGEDNLVDRFCGVGCGSSKKVLTNVNNENGNATEQDNYLTQRVRGLSGASRGGGTPAVEFELRAIDENYYNCDEIEALDGAVEKDDGLIEFVEEQDAQVDGPQSKNNDGKATDLKVI